MKLRLKSRRQVLAGRGSSKVCLTESFLTSRLEERHGNLSPDAEEVGWRRSEVAGCFSSPQLWRGIAFHGAVLPPDRLGCFPLDKLDVTGYSFCHRRVAERIHYKFRRRSQSRDYREANSATVLKLELRLRNAFESSPTPTEAAQGDTVPRIIGDLVTPHR